MAELLYAIFSIGKKSEMQHYGAPLLIDWQRVLINLKRHRGTCQEVSERHKLRPLNLAEAYNITA